MGAPPDLRPSPHQKGVSQPSPQPSPQPPPQSPQQQLSHPSNNTRTPLPHRQKRATALSSPLPSLRILVHPTPGLGIDLRLPLSRRTRCYMQLDSFFNGPSQIRIGLHARNNPGMRLQLSPHPRVSVRVPLHIGGAKFLQMGLWCGGGGGDGWKGGIGMGWGVVLEIWRYTTGLGFLDEGVRKGVRNVLDGRERENRLDGIPVDPREKERVLEILKDVLGERRRVREGRTGIPYGAVVGKDGKLR